MISSVTQSPVFAGKAVIKVDSRKSVNALKADLQKVASNMGKKDVAYGQMDARADQIVICGMKRFSNDGYNVHVVVKDNGTDENLIEYLRKVFTKKDSVITYDEYVKKLEKENR